jgi:hypothetical protein
MWSNKSKTWQVTQPDDPQARQGGACFLATLMSEGRAHETSPCRQLAVYALFFWFAHLRDGSANAPESSGPLRHTQFEAQDAA